MSKPLRVLLVEDSEDDALLLIRTLKKNGYDPECERVETAETMRTALKKKLWDVILCDYKLPKFSALNALDLYKEAGIVIPFIIVSGTIGEETAVELMKAGAHDYIMKDKLSRLVPAIDREMKDAVVRSKSRQAEQFLKESEERFSTIFQASPVSMAITRMEGNQLIDVNKAWSEATGFSRDEAVGRNPLDLGVWADPADRERLIGVLHKEGVVRDFDCRLRYKSGRLVDMSLSAMKIDLSGEPFMLTIALDISDRKRMEKISAARIRMMEFAVSHSLQDVLQRTLDEIEALTHSPIGFYHFVEADQKTLSLQAWSTRTVKEFCTAPGKRLHYGIDNAGVWVDCVHQRRPVIHNDYAAAPQGNA